MKKDFDYTAIAQRVTSRFPRLSFVGTQINFWVISNVLLGIILHFQAIRITQSLGIPAVTRFLPIMVSSVILGVLYGICLGLTDYYLDKRVYKKLPLGKVILFKTATSLSILLLILFFLRYGLPDLVLSSANNNAYFITGDQSWKYLFYLLMIYYFFMTLMINFINQVNKKYGPGVLVPLLLGKYRNPREEERIFMFMDLKSSTTVAEKLGHLKYSSFIRDSFMDINEVVPHYNAQVYQYVGDEIVLSWNVKDGLKDFSCIRFFFACEEKFNDRSGYYMQQYGLLPDFKAAVHMGLVTAVEIGEIKRDIAYHGDTLNTTARIQNVCNEYNRKFLISAYLLEKIGLSESLRTEHLGMIQLRGKTMKVGVSGIDWIENQ